MGEEIKKRRKKLSYSEMDLMLSSIAKDTNERIINEKEPGEYSKAVFALCQVMAQLGKIKSVSALEKRLQVLEKAFKDGRESTN